MPRSNSGELCISPPNALQLLFKIALIFLVHLQDTVALSRALKKYADMDYSFGNSKEGRLLFEISKAMEDGDGERFQSLSQDYRDKWGLPEWKQALLAKGFVQLKSAEDDFS